ncbi:MAG: DnaB-like helicase C-terminal domain-containing protein [Sandaracinaceae bacterium]
MTGPILTDAAAERDFLALPLLDGSIDPAAAVEAEHFASPQYGAIWTAYQTLAARGEPLELLTLRAELERTGLIGNVGERTILELEDHVPTSSAATLAERIRHLSRGRDRHRKLRRALQDLEAGQIEEADSLVIELADTSFNTGSVEIRSAGKAVEAVILRAMARAQGQASDLVPIGLAPVDKQVGGLSPGSLTIIAGDTGVGKSTTALFGLGEVERDLEAAVGYVSCEDPEDVMGGKLLAAETGISPDVFRTQDLTREQWEAVSAAAHRVHDRKIEFAYPIGGSVSDVCAAMVRLVREKGARIVVVDYLQTINGDRAESRREEVRRIVSRIKSTAKALEIPVVLLSQFKRREHPYERPTRWDLKESGDIENMAEAIVLLWKPEGQDVHGVLDKSKWTAPGMPFLMKRGRDGLLRAVEIDNRADAYADDASGFQDY